jgi:hypothetical protein
VPRRGPRLPAPSQKGAPWTEQPRKGGRRPGSHSRAIPGFEGRCIPVGEVHPPSPYRGGYASVRRLAGRGASALSMHGLFGNGPRTPGGAFSGGRSSLRLAGTSQDERLCQGAPPEDAEAGHDATQRGRICRVCRRSGRFLGNIAVLKGRVRGESVSACRRPDFGPLPGAGP